MKVYPALETSLDITVEHCSERILPSAVSLSFCSMQKQEINKILDERVMLEEFQHSLADCAWRDSLYYSVWHSHKALESEIIQAHMFQEFVPIDCLARQHILIEYFVAFDPEEGPHELMNEFNDVCSSPRLPWEIFVTAVGRIAVGRIAVGKLGRRSIR